MSSNNGAGIAQNDSQLIDELERELFGELPKPSKSSKRQNSRSARRQRQIKNETGRKPRILVIG